MFIILINNTKIDTCFEKLDTIFKVLFLVFGLLNYNSFFICQPIMSIIVIIVTAFAGVMLLYRLINWRYFVNNKFLWLLIVFLASYAVSMLLTYKYGIVTPLKTAVWMGIQYLLIFATDSRKSMDFHKKQINILSVVYLIYIFIMNIISLIFMLFNYSFEREIIQEGKEPYIVRIGYIIGRLWGTYSDPNYASVIVVIAIIFAIYFINKINKKGIRALLIISIVIDVLYITFSDSRTGLVAGIAAFGATTYFIAYKYNKLKSESKWLKNGVCLVLAVVVAFGFTATLKGLKTGYRQIVSYQIDHMDEQEKEDWLEIKKADEEREEYIKGDISNRRFDLWGASLDIIKSHPLFGVTFNHIQQYTEDNFPDNYLINNSHGKYDNYHNSFINIAAGQGTIGFVLVVLITVLSVIVVLKKLFGNIDRENGLLYIILFGVLVAIFCGAMFLSDLVYVNSATATLFWYILGVLVIKDKNEVKKA